MALDRRAFISILGGVSLAWPRAVEALARELARGGAPDDEVFWALVRARFIIPTDRIYLNNGTLGPSPHLVLEAVTEHARRVAMTYPPGVAWDDVKRALADLLGGDPEGFVFPRSTTEAMNFVANGLELAAGDVVLTTDHEHVGGLEPWRLVTRRRNASLDVASLPDWEHELVRGEIFAIEHTGLVEGSGVDARFPVENQSVRMVVQPVAPCGQH